VVGNIEQFKHLANGAGFTRDFNLVLGNNRLQTLKVGLNPTAYTYDTNGNMTQESTSRHFEWDYADRMRVYRTQTDASEPSVLAHYLYDAGGQRVKKLVRKQGGQVEVTVYIDGVFEYQRIVQGGTAEENNTLHVMDNQSRIALVRVGNPFASDTTPAVKYQLGDHLGSSNLVIDSTGNLVNREEYTPYGETSFGSFARKRYRFTGKERDEESGLNYHGARYYSSWIGRWTSCDPAGLVDGLNLYTYVMGNPMMSRDATELAGTDCDTISSTPPTHPVSPSANNKELPKEGNSPTLGSNPDPKTDPVPDNPAVRPVDSGVQGSASSNEVAKPERKPTEKPTTIDPKLGPILTRREDKPPQNHDSDRGGWWKYAFLLGIVVIAGVIAANAPPSVGAGTAAPAAGLANPPLPVPPNSAPTTIGIRQATDIEAARRAFAEADRVGIKLRIGVATDNEMLASTKYLEKFYETRNWAEAGQAFHDQVGAPRSGPDRFFFGSVDEVKTKNPFRLISGDDMLKAIKQAEGYRSKGPPTVTFFEIGTGNKYVISR
jgi:RHS repeat-associated protein